MPRLLAPLLALWSCAAAFAQILPNSITVTASNNVNLQPDQAIFSVTVQSDLSVGLDDVVAAVQSAGITAANLAGVSTAIAQFGLQSKTSMDV